MAENNLDFDRIIDRKSTNSLKYDFAAERGKPIDILPFWVADMDFQVSSYIQDALLKQVEHGIFGADMQIELVNEGPFTVVLDNSELGF